MEQESYTSDNKKRIAVLPAATSLITKAIEYTIFKMMLAETVLTVREIAAATNYSIREIQHALTALIKQNLVVKTKLDYPKAPVYHLDRGRIQNGAGVSNEFEDIPVH